MKSKKWKKPFVYDKRYGIVASPYPILLTKGDYFYKKAKEMAEYKMNMPFPNDYSVMPYSFFDINY